MDPNVWGPACWRLVFAATFRLPRESSLALFEALRYVLPCVHCRQSYRMYVKRLPPASAIDQTPNSAARYAWTIKDYVSQKTGGGALPFSVLCARHKVFESPVSRMDVADFLCCMAMQVEDKDQAEAYETFAGVMDDLLKDTGEPMEMHLPLDAKFKTPATLWLHALKVKNELCDKCNRPSLTREDMIARYRSDDAKKTDTNTVSSARSSRSAGRSSSRTSRRS